MPAPRINTPSSASHADAVVAVWPARALAQRTRLFAALAAAFDVGFAAWDAAAPPSDAVIAFGEPPDAVRATPAPLLTLAGEQSAGDAREPVHVSSDPAVDRRLRGIVLERAAAVRPLEVREGERVLAAAGSAAVWTAAGGGARRWRVAFPLPELLDAEVLREALLGRNGVGLIAAVELLRGLAGATASQRPPLRATILFDDPNLRRPSYGFIDYRRLVEHADAHGYHAAMAMIPLDASRPHPAAAALFAARPDRLSLVFHGNNHSKRELLQPSDSAAAQRLAAQALSRMTAFEARSGLRVDRVMTPPHGMCSQSMTRVLGAAGFDALCAIHPSPWLGAPAPERLLAGWEPADFPAECAVIPRVPLGFSAADIALRAFLDHPIVLYGHHDDLATGLEPLEQAVARVNRLGDVRWTSLGMIARSNYAVRVRGTTAIVRPFAARVRVNLPEGASTLVVEPPYDSGDAFKGWSAGGAVTPFATCVAQAGERTLELRLHPARELDLAAVPLPRWSPWPVVRRAATEARDRTWPLRA